MKYILTHIQDWLTVGGSTIPGGEWIFLLVLLLSATIILNAVTDTANYSRMTGNFLSLAGGALLGSLIIPDWSPPLDPPRNSPLPYFRA